MRGFDSRRRLCFQTSHLKRHDGESQKEKLANNFLKRLSC